MNEILFKNPKLHQLENGYFELRYDWFYQGEWKQAKSSYTAEYAQQLFNELSAFFGSTAASPANVEQEQASSPIIDIRKMLENKRGAVKNEFILESTILQFRGNVIQEKQIDDRIYRLQTVLCGKKGCSKCANLVGHGPYWYVIEDGTSEYLFNPIHSGQPA